MNHNGLRQIHAQLGLGIAIALQLAGCADLPQRPNVAQDTIFRELDRAANERKPVTPEAVSQALLPPLVVEMPRGDIQKPDTRFDLSVNNAPAGQVFMAIV